MEGRRVLTPQVALELARMMQATMDYGTASSAFAARGGVLERLIVGGKTGTLTSESPPGHCQWLVGWAFDPVTGRSLAFATISLRSGIKSTSEAKDLSKNLLAAYFEGRDLADEEVAEAGVRSRHSQPLVSLTSTAVDAGLGPAPISRHGSPDAAPVPQPASKAASRRLAARSRRRSSRSSASRHSASTRPTATAQRSSRGQRGHS